MSKKKMWRRYQEVAIGFTLLFIVLASAVFSPLIATHDPLAFNMSERLQAPSKEHIAGTDHFGRDIFSRIIYGSRISMIIAVSVIVICGTVGVFLGLVAGYYKKVEATVMRLLDGFMAFPSVLLALVVLAALGPGIKNIVIALSISYMPRVARTVRGSVVVVKEYEHVEAARALGTKDRDIIFRHILPLCWSPIIVRLTLIMALTILSEASLTFLGVGLSPDIPSWGNILSEGRLYMTTAPWITVIPGIAILIAVLGLNMMGDGLRDLLDTRLSD